MMEKDEQNQYLGADVYASFDGSKVWLTSWEGDQIALEYAVWLEVVEYGKKMYQIKESETK